MYEMQKLKILKNRLFGLWEFWLNITPENFSEKGQNMPPGQISMKEIFYSSGKSECETLKFVKCKLKILAPYSKRA